MATEYAAPFSGTAITTSQQYRDRYRPGQWDYVDDNINGTSLAVTNAANVNVNIANGPAIVQGASYSLTAGPAVLAVAANGGGSNRFDIVVLRYDASHNPGVYLAIVQGVAGSGMPALTRSATGVWEMPLAHYEKQPGGNIVNLVDRRIYSDGTGGIIGPDVNWAPVGPGRRTGMRFRDWTQGVDYTYNGASWVEDGILSSYIAYTPVWTSSGTAPAIGNGTIVGRYKVLAGKNIMFYARIIAGTTTTYGTGNYSLSLPPTAACRTTDEQFTQARIFDSSAGLAYVGQGVLSGTTVLLQALQPTLNPAILNCTNTHPMTGTTGDRWSTWGVFETV